MTSTGWGLGGSGWGAGRSATCACAGERPRSWFSPRLAEARGRVARERSASDRRVVQIALTPEGQAVAARVPPVLAEVLNGHLSDFTHDEWQQLLHLLRRMLANGEARRQQQSQNT